MNETARRIAKIYEVPQGQNPLQQKKAIKSQRAGTQSTNPRTRQKLQFNPVAGPVPVVLKNIQEMKPNKNSFILSRINEDTL